MKFLVMIYWILYGYFYMTDIVNIQRIDMDEHFEEIVCYLDTEFNICWLDIEAKDIQSYTGAIEDQSSVNYTQHSECIKDLNDSVIVQARLAVSDTTIIYTPAFRLT